MKKVYNAPPIIEVIFEMTFTKDTKWDSTIPGLFYKDIRDDFPIKDKRSILTASAIPSNDPNIAQSNMFFYELTVFKKEDKSIFVQIGERLITVNHIAPYRSWEEFKPYIEKTYNNVKKNIENYKLSRISLKYINQIELNATKSNLEQYFEFKPLLPSAIHEEYEDFIVGCNLFYPNRDRLIIQLSSRRPRRDNNNPIFFDLNYFKECDNDTHFTMDWVQNAHDNIANLFEKCITDELRKTFDERN